jgi:DNA processing protein
MRPVSPEPGIVGLTAPRAPGAWPDGFADTTADRDACLVLAHLEGLTPAGRHALAWQEGTASACVRAVARGAARASSRDRAVAAGLDLGGVRAALRRAGARLVVPGEQVYPSELLDLPDPPVSLFVRGRARVRCSTAVAIVGARRCTAYGREVAAWLARELARVGVAVVSGAALGIDGAAHRGALAGAGTTIAVLGSGIDIPHPRTNRRLIDEVARRGLLLSEYPPGVEARPHRFPARNRLVAGLARGVVVVEGAPDSGSLITAEFAGDLGREVMAVPGAITGPLSSAPHALIRDGAALIRGPQDVLSALGMEPRGGSTGREPGPEEASAAAGLTAEERSVLAAVPGTPSTLDAVAAAAGVAPGLALRALSSLELRGLVAATGGRYGRTAGAGR